MEQPCSQGSELLSEGELPWKSLNTVRADISLPARGGVGNREPQRPWEVARSLSSVWHQREWPRWLRMGQLLHGHLGSPLAAGCAWAGDGKGSGNEEDYCWDRVMSGLLVEVSLTWETPAHFENS